MYIIVIETIIPTKKYCFELTRITNPKIIFKISKDKKYQMEHSNIGHNDYDTYHYERFC